MKIAILSRKATLYSTNSLKEAAQRRGHEVHVIDYLRCYMDITSHKPKVVFGGKPLEGFDAIVPRVGASHFTLLAAVEVLGKMPTSLASGWLAEKLGYTLAELAEGKSKAKRMPAAPKYRHPENPALTWSGRGRKPQWFVEALAAGKTAEDLAIG